MRPDLVYHVPPDFYSRCMQDQIERLRRIEKHAEYAINSLWFFQFRKKAQYKKLIDDVRMRIHLLEQERAMN
jgi:hypothetical protein